MKLGSLVLSKRMQLNNMLEGKSTRYKFHFLTENFRFLNEVRFGKLVRKN